VKRVIDRLGDRVANSSPLLQTCAALCVAVALTILL